MVGNFQIKKELYHAREEALNLDVRRESSQMEAMRSDGRGTITGYQGCCDEDRFGKVASKLKKLSARGISCPGVIPGMCLFLWKSNIAGKR